MGRLGEQSINNFGSIIKIVYYNNANDINVYFPEYNWTFYGCRYDYFKNGTIRCPYEPRFRKVGYIGEGEYTFEIGDKCSNTWNHMLQRCYDKKYQSKKPTYIGCTVCEEWHNFQNFAKWYEENYYEVDSETMHLDKDILYKGNKIYSPSTCIFVPNRINTLFTKSNLTRGKYPIGVNIDNKTHKFRARCSIFDNINKKVIRVTLGSYNNEIEAFQCYKRFKENYIKEVAEEYKNLIPTKLYEAMYKYEVEITD